MLPCRQLRKYVSIVIGFSTILLLYNILTVSVDWEYNATFDYECQNNVSETYPQMQHYCIQGPRIFFTETSGASVLTARQACAVESTSRNNPNLDILLLMTPENGIDVHHPLMSSLQRLPNVEIRQIDIDVFVHGTPIWAWFRTGKWKKSRWKVSHLSDALRFLVVWKYGGMYLDLDIVTLRSMEHLRNAVITENWDRVASGILIFDKGHELMRLSMEDFALHYDRTNFAFNGPGVISRNIRAYCDIEDMSKVSGTGCGIDILPPEAAFPIPWEEWEKYFESSDIENISAHFNGSYMLHVWNKSSASKKLKVGTNSLYEKAIVEHCPATYKYAQILKYI